jgi:hypothetical protein
MLDMSTDLNSAPFPPFSDCVFSNQVQVRFNDVVNSSFEGYVSIRYSNSQIRIFECLICPDLNFFSFPFSDLCVFSNQVQVRFNDVVNSSFEGYVYVELEKSPTGLERLWYMNQTTSPTHGVAIVSRGVATFAVRLNV